MNIRKNILLTDIHGKPIGTDIFFEATGTPKPVIIYAHGFNGFKDWGNFDLIAKRFAAAGFVFVKFNFSFNGTTPEHPEDFTDLPAFGENNYTKELDNLRAVVDWIAQPDHPDAAEIDATRIGLLGHSMGGGIVLIHAAEDPRVSAVATWASVSVCQTPWGSWPADKLRAWKATGVQYITNGRTKQEMPLYYQLYEDYQQHQSRLDIEAAVRRLSIPLLLCHGTGDPAVPVASAHLLKSWSPDAQLFLVDADHVFGRKHPWLQDDLPAAMEAVLVRTLDFFRESM